MHQWIRCIWLAAVGWLCCCACGEPRQERNLTHQGKTVADTEVWRAQLAEDATNQPLRLQLAGALSASGRRAEAISLLRDGLRIDSTSTALWNALAVLQSATGDTTAALAGLRTSLRLDPRQAAPRLELGFIYAAMGDKRAEDLARQLLQEGLGLEVRLQSWYLLGVHYGNQGMTERALAAFDSCIVLRYTFLDAHIERGILLVKERRYKEALGCFRRASAVDKSNADAWYWQGECLEAEGEPLEAADSYARALALDTTLKAAARGLERTAKRVQATE